MVDHEPAAMSIFYSLWTDLQITPHSEARPASSVFV